MKELKRLNKYFIRYKFHLLLGIVFIILSNWFSVQYPQYVGQGLDLIASQSQSIKVLEGFDAYDLAVNDFKSNLIIVGLLILGAAFLKGFFLFLTRQTIIVMSRHIEYDLKNDIYQHYQTLPLSFYRKNNTGDLITRISEDVSKTRMYIGPAMMYGVNLVVLFILVITNMYMTNPTLATYTLAPLPLLSISIYFVSNHINKQSEKIQKSLSRLSTFVQEAFSGIRVIKGFIKEEENAEKFLEESNEYRQKSLKLSLINSLFMPLILTLIGLSTVITVYIGSLQAASGDNVTVGNIAKFVIYVNMLTWPVTSLGWVTSIVQRAAASQERINEFLDTKSDIVSQKNLSKELEGKLEFQNISLTYPDSGIKALDNISFSIEHGDTVAIVGGTGSGKSTIANLLCRMYDPNQGTILVDDTDIKDFNINIYRNQIGYAPQDAFLFSDTIRHNVAFGKDGASQEEIETATKRASIFDSIMSFPEGFNTKVGERGVTLSGGQKQRITIARALIRNPKILILDDSLSAVDTKTEDQILKNLSEVTKNRTSIIISHRVSSVKLANHIIVLQDGKIAEQGSHDQLMEKNGPYKMLYDEQMKVSGKKEPID